MCIVGFFRNNLRINPKKIIYMIVHACELQITFTYFIIMLNNPLYIVLPVSSRKGSAFSQRWLKPTEIFNKIIKKIFHPTTPDSLPARARESPGALARSRAAPRGCA